MESKCRDRMHVCDGKAAKFIGEHEHAPNGQRKHVLDVFA